ncbi:MAG: DUF116 domain-containing protein [Chloroflexi bacterium]|nr:DUF116 domain-containing protein [Chloroflexota bacterium]
MTRIITYSLRLDGRNSDEYYRAIAAFADGWFACAVRDAEPTVAGFRNHRLARGDADRSDAEYTLELLTLGVLLREHGGDAVRMRGWLARLATALIRLQDRWPRWEDSIKRVRGWVGRWMARRTAQALDGDDVDRMIAWLRANDRTGQAARLSQWQSYFSEIGESRARAIVAECVALAADFAEASQQTLGRYTEGVPQFLTESAPRFVGRYDAEFVSRTRLEYHLGMLGTEILSRAYRQRFLSTQHKIVIVPPCMRAQPEEKCKAIETPLGAKCQACTPTCRVHQITKLGEKRGFEVFMIPDELRVFGKGVGAGSLGVVGVACALTNWSGGWEADSMGVPAQGVLLDYVGCKYHWDDDGIPTDANLRKLEEVVGGKL